MLGSALLHPIGGRTSRPARYYAEPFRPDFDRAPPYKLMGLTRAQGLGEVGFLAPVKARSWQLLSCSTTDMGGVATVVVEAALCCGRRCPGGGRAVAPRRRAGGGRRLCRCLPAPPVLRGLRSDWLHVAVLALALASRLRLPSVEGASCRGRVRLRLARSTAPARRARSSEQLGAGGLAWPLVATLALIHVWRRRLRSTRPWKPPARIEWLLFYATAPRCRKAW